MPNDETFSFSPPVEKLYEIGGIQLVSEVTKTALGQCEERMKSAEECFEEEDWAALGRLAHGLRSSAGVLGANDLLEKASQLEKAMDEAQDHPPDRYFTDLRTTFAETAITWRAWISLGAKD